MQVQDIMVRDVVCCAPQDSVLVAAQLMRDRDVGCVVVADAGLIQGIITDRDIAVRCFAEGHDGRCLVLNHATRPVVTIDLEVDVDQAAQLMADCGVRRLPVLQAGRVIGMLSVSNLAWTLNKPIHGLLYGEAAAQHR